MPEREIQVDCSFSEDGEELEILLLRSFRLFLIRELNALVGHVL